MNKANMSKAILTGAKRLLVGIGSAAALLLVLGARSAEAAPQVLAALTLGDAGEPFVCDASGTCRAEFSTYCLEKTRQAPLTGSAYVPAAAGHFTLVLTAADGTERRLPAGKHVRFMSARSFVAVRALLDARTLAAFGASSARLEIAAGATLLPVPVDGDPNPLTAREIAYARTSLRKRGSAIVDATPEAGAAMLLGRVAAAIEPLAPATPENLQRLWQKVIDRTDGGRPGSEPARIRAREFYQWCQQRSSYHSMAGIKDCLEFRHDDAIMRLNTDYWKSQPVY